MYLHACMYIRHTNVLVLWVLGVKVKEILFAEIGREREGERHTDFSLRHKSFVVNFLRLSMLVVC